MKRYSDIKEVWSDLDKGITIHWQNEGYKIYVESAYPNNRYQKNHFTNRKDEVLAIRHIETYFGCLIQKSEISGLYSKEEK